MPRKGVHMSEEALARQREAIKRWHEENTTKICIRVRKEEAAAYRALAEKKGCSFTSLIRDHLNAECDAAGIEHG